MYLKTLRGTEERAQPQLWFITRHKSSSRGSDAFLLVLRGTKLTYSTHTYVHTKHTK